MNAQLIEQRWAEEKARLSISSPPEKAMGDLDEQLDTTTDQKQDVEVVGRQEARQKVIEEVRKEEESLQGDRDGYIPAPGTRDEKGEWQPESWKPSATKPIRR